MNNFNLFQNWKVISYMLTFFLAMILHELALEAVFKLFPDLNSLAQSVTLFQFGFCFGLPFFLSRKTVSKTFPKSLEQTLPYIRLSLLVFGSTALATASLKYVSFPTKVVFKSAKLIPTMILSTLLHTNRGSIMTKNDSSDDTTNKESTSNRYSVWEYMAAGFLCLGAAGYSYGSGISFSADDGKNAGANADETYGIILLSVSVFCDALVPNLQQKLMMPIMTKIQPEDEELPKALLSQGRNDEKNPKDHYQVEREGLSASGVMVNVNAVGFGALAMYMILSGSLKGAIAISIEDPFLLLYLTIIGLGLSTAVLAYTKLIEASGSVVAVTVATLRKVFTIMLSYIVFPKPILTIHIFSGLSVLMGILINSYCA